MAELDNSALINDLLSGLLLEEVEQNAPVEPKGLMSSKTGTNTSADAAAAEAELQPKSGRASITEFIQKLSAADTPNEGESGGTLGSVNYLTMDDMYRKYNTPLYKLGSLNRDTGSDEDAAALKVKRNTNFGDAYLDSLGAAMDKSDTNSKRESILSEGKASTLFDRKAAEDLASTFLEGLQDKYQEKRINPNVKPFPEQSSFAVTELDDAVVGGASDGKVDEGLISSNASDDPSEESTFGEVDKGLMSRPSYDKEAMLDNNEPEGGSFAIIYKENKKNSLIGVTVPRTNAFNTLALSEGEDIHLDGKNIITLPYGIVPDKDSITKADGTSIDPKGSHGLSTADLSGIDYSAATKFGISREDYASDEAFGKAVFAEFTIRAEKEFGTDFANATDEAKQAVYDLAWNAGVTSAGWNDTELMVTEAGKSLKEQSTNNLIQFTQNFKMTDKNGIATYPRGLLKRRVVAYNYVAKPGEEAADIFTTAVTNTAGTRVGTKYDIRTSSGNILKTYTKPDKDEKLGSLALS